MSKKTIDTETGIIYPTFKQACDGLGLNLQKERLHRHRLYYFEEFMEIGNETILYSGRKLPDKWEELNLQKVPEEELISTRNSAYKYLIE